MSDGELPKAVATGGTATPANDDGALAAVSPRRAAVAIGGLVGLFAFALLFIVTPPTEALGLVGGPRTELERYGGLRMVWEPPPGIDTRQLADRYARSGNAFVVEVPHVWRDDIAATAERLGGRGRLEFHEVREVREMAELARVLELPMRNQEPVDVEVDQWHPEDGGPAHTDFYLHGHSRGAIVGALAEAEHRGWKLPPGTHIAFERTEREGRPDEWRTYVLADEVAIDGSAIANAMGEYDPSSNRPIVLLDFTRQGSIVFGDLTTRIAGHKLATVLDGDVKSAPVINGPIRGGRASITMGGADPQKQARDRDALVSTLGAGGLPRGGRIVEASYVEPSSYALKLTVVRILLAGLGGAVAAGLAWLAVRLLRPYRRREQRLAGTARIDTRIAWTGLGIALFVICATITLPGINGVELEHMFSSSFRGSGEPSLFAYEYVSIFAIGLVPIITSHVIIEIVASIVPRWRKLRDTGPAGRRKLGIATAIATLVLAIVQAYFVAVYLESLSRGGADLMPHTGMAMRGLIVATLVAGTMSLAWLASVMTRRGIGNGYAVLMVGGWLLHLPMRLERLSHAELGLFVVASGAIAGIYLVVSRWRVRGMRSVDIPVPTAGIAPLSDAGGLMMLIGTLAALGVFGDGTMRAVSWIEPLHYETIGFVVVVVAAIGWTFAFARPGRRATELARAELTAPTGEMWLRATVLGALALVAIRAIDRITLRADATLASLIDPVMLLVATATIADVVAEARDRKRGLVAVWPLHDPLFADVVRDRLAGAGIDSHVQAKRLRSLLWVFGSYVPMHVLVPEEHAERAVKLVGELFE